MTNEIKQTCEISFKLNNKEDLSDINEAINDFINIDDDVHISIDKYYEDDNYNYFLVIAIYHDDKHLSKITKLKKEEQNQ